MNESQPDNVPLDGVVSAAILIDALPPALAIRVLRQLEPSSVRTLLHMKSDPRLEDRRLLLEAIERFQSDASKSMSSVSEDTVPTRDTATGSLNRPRRHHSSSFDFLQRATPRVRVGLLKDEHPRNIAIILSSISPAAASETLGQFEESLRYSVVKRLCDLEEIPADEIVELRYQILQRMKRLSSLESNAKHQLEFATKLVSCCEADEQERLLAYFEQVDSDLANKIRCSLVQFEDLSRLNLPMVRTVLRHIDTSWVAPALKNASASVKRTVLDAMAPGVVQIVQREMDQLVRVNKASESQARLGFIQTMVELAEKGMIDLVARQTKDSQDASGARAA